MLDAWLLSACSLLRGMALCLPRFPTHQPCCSAIFASFSVGHCGRRRRGDVGRDGGDGGGSLVGVGGQVAGQLLGLPNNCEPALLSLKKAICSQTSLAAEEEVAAGVTNVL